MLCFAIINRVLFNLLSVWILNEPEFVIHGIEDLLPGAGSASTHLGGAEVSS